uniref:Uncharacterized protein n=1 Tax=Leersia perrieri TaxID=77586 RepID=A0A0D9VFF8_9ORYZ
MAFHQKKISQWHNPRRSIPNPSPFSPPKSATRHRCCLSRVQIASVAAAGATSVFRRSHQGRHPRAPGTISQNRHRPQARATVTVLSCSPGPLPSASPILRAARIHRQGSVGRSVTGWPDWPAPLACSTTNSAASDGQPQRLRGPIADDLFTGELSWGSGEGGNPLSIA